MLKQTAPKGAVEDSVLATAPKAAAVDLELATVVRLEVGAVVGWVPAAARAAAEARARVARRAGVVVKMAWVATSAAT
jgi:hypothetical protein